MSNDLTPSEIRDNQKRSLMMPDAYEADEAEIESSRAPLMDHLIELRSRLIWMVVAFIAAFIFCFAFSREIYIFLLHPFEMASRMLEQTKVTGHSLSGSFDLMFVLMGLKDVEVEKGTLSLIYTAPLEFFFTKVKVAMFGAIIIAFPFIAWQVYRFVAPGLYKRERMAFAPFLVAAPVLFSIGAALVYYIILPMVLWFSLNQQIIGDAGVSVSLMPKVSDYLSLVTTLILAFGLCFQLPIVITLLGLTGMVSSKMLGEMRRYAIFGIIVVAAIFTPPDPFSQLMLAIPICLLYEVSILCVKIIEWRRGPEEVEAGA